MMYMCGCARVCGCVCVAMPPALRPPAFVHVASPDRDSCAAVPALFLGCLGARGAPCAAPTPHSDVLAAGLLEGLTRPGLGCSMATPLPVNGFDAFDGDLSSVLPARTKHQAAGKSLAQGLPPPEHAKARKRRGGLLAAREGVPCCRLGIGSFSRPNGVGVSMTTSFFVLCPVTWGRS